MNRTFLARALALAVALVSANALAAWTPVGELFDGSGFYDKASIKKSGDTARVKILVNFKQPDPPKNGARGAASSLAVMEFDCVKPLARRVSVEGRSEKDGKGFVTKENTTMGAWKSINVENFTHQDPLLRLRRIACPAGKE